MIKDIRKLGGMGASNIGSLFMSQGLKAKTAHTLAYTKAKEIITGRFESITTVAMQHGVFNEEEAFNTVIKPFFPKAVYQSSDSIYIKNGVWVTPDVIDNSEEITFDIKCPYSPYTFHQNIKKPKDGYISQVQMQMIGTKHDKGFLVYYLTSNKTDEWGNKIEYDIPVEQRHKYIPVPSDETFQKEILKRIDDFFVIRDSIVIDLKNAVAISDQELFDYCDSNKVTRFKDKSNLTTWGGRIYLCSGEYYTIE